VLDPTYAFVPVHFGALLALMRRASFTSSLIAPVIGRDRPAREAEIGILRTSCVTSGTFDSAENREFLD